MPSRAWPQAALWQWRVRVLLLEWLRQWRRSDRGEGCASGQASRAAEEIAVAETRANSRAESKESILMTAAKFVFIMDANGFEHLVQVAHIVCISPAGKTSNCPEGRYLVSVSDGDSVTIDQKVYESLRRVLTEV
jgi:hypothetical protein